MGRPPEREGMTPVIAPPPARQVQQRVGGLALVAVGVPADIWAGAAVLAGDAAHGLLVHLAAALAWGFGVGFLASPAARWGDRLSGRAGTALLLGLLLFPGL